MKSKTWICILCIETVLALFFAAAAAQSYGQAVPLPCLKSRSSLTMPPCVTPSVRPMPQTSGLRTLSTNSTANGKTRMKMRISPMASRGESQSLRGYATWYSTNSVVADYKRRGQAIPTNGVFPMANGMPLDDNAMTCALWKTNKHNRPLKPDGRIVKITNVQTMQAIIVAWTDNGPGRVPRSQGVICDLTPAAFKALGGNLRDGKIEVAVEEL